MIWIHHKNVEICVCFCSVDAVLLGTGTALAESTLVDYKCQIFLTADTLGKKLYPLLQPADTILGKLEFQYYRLETGGLQFPHPVHRTQFLSVIMCPTCQCANLCFNLPKRTLSERNQYVTVEGWL